MRKHLSRVIGIVLLASLGCSKGHVVTKDAGLGDFLQQFELALMDARGTLESVQAAASKPKDEGSEEDPPDVQIRSVLQMVASAAQQLHESAAGHAAEPEVKSILTDAQALLQKSQGSTNAMAALQGVQQLTTKAEALKGRM